MKILPNGELPDRLKERVSFAADLAVGLGKPYLVFSGGVRDGYPSESSAARRFLFGLPHDLHGIPVFLEERAKNTIENAIYCRELVDEVLPPPTHCWIFAVTDLTHLARWNVAVQRAFDDTRFILITPCGPTFEEDIRKRERILRQQPEGLLTIQEAFIRAGENRAAVPGIYHELAEAKRSRK